MNFRIGCDPELFLQDATGGLHSAIGLIGGTKQEPRPLPCGEGFAVQEDNVALEFNIPAAESKAQLQEYISRVMNTLKKEIRPYNYQFSKLSAALFPEEDIKHPMAMVFGCDPDFNAWTNGKRNPRPKADDHRLRSAGGHVHVGYQFKQKTDILTLTKLMDLCLAVPSVLMDQGELRKQLYGKAGAFRVKPYGMEYRTLSNFWVAQEDPNYVGWVWDATAQAIQLLESNSLDVDSLEQDILNAVNNNNKETAHHLCRAHNLICL